MNYVNTVVESGWESVLWRQSVVDRYTDKAARSDEIPADRVVGI